MPEPVLQALVLADHVYEEVSGKYIIAGTFNTVTAPDFPSQYQGSPCAYILLAEVHGQTTVSLRFVDLLDDKVLLRATIGIENADPLQSVQIGIHVPRLRLPHPGVYRFELLHDGVLLGSLRINVLKANPQKPAQAQLT